MVRLYCLTRIYKIEPNKYYNGEKVIPYPDGSDENLFTGIKEGLTAAHILELNFSRYYELTEISIGYEFVNDRKVFVMHFYRDDTRLCVIRMIRGAVRFHQTTRNALDLTISTSTLFCGKVDLDLFMRIRWVKPSPTGPNIIDKTEEKRYREFAEERKNEEISNYYRDDTEPLYEEIKLEMPNSSKENVLRTKMSRFLTLIRYLCDPNVGSYKNVPNDYEYNQQVKCFLAERSWKSQKPRKNELEKQAKDFRDCRDMNWNNLSMKNQKLDKVDAKHVISATYNNVNIFDVNQELFFGFKSMFQNTTNFKLLKYLSLINCYIQELTDDFFDILPKQITFLGCSGNNITKISKNISYLQELRNLNLNYNNKLGDEGIPWESLPPRLEHLQLHQTNISVVPTKIQSLKNLQVLEISSKILNHVEWFEISDTIVQLIIEGGNRLNEIDLTSKLKLETVHIIQTGLSGIDCSKLPANVYDFKMSNNKMKEFDAKNILQNVVALSLVNNGLKTIKWENLPVILQILFIERNNLTLIDDGVSQLTNLGYLSAFNNNITKMSDKFYRLQHLSSLVLNNNKISSLPRCFELLLNLKKLDLSHNKFNYQQTDLLETLWKRLPTSLNVLRLGGNTLKSLPCWLKKYNLADLQVDNCKLSHICPNLYSKRQNQNQYLNIEKNRGIRFLPFLPDHIYCPHNGDDCENVDDLNSNFLVFINPEMVIGKPISVIEPLYQFRKNENVNLRCQCCANCGNETEEAIIEQLMIMDFKLDISTEEFISTDDEISEEAENRDYPADTSILLLPPPTINLPSKRTSYSPGKWQTVVRTRLCVECLKTIKAKIADSQKSNIKKMKSNENKIEEIIIPLSSHLLLWNFNGNDSKLNAILNLFDAMNSVRDIICNGFYRNSFRQELSNILQRKVYTIESLRKLIPHFTIRDNIGSTFVKIMELMNDKIKKLLQFSYEKKDFCMCRCRKSEGLISSFILSISVGSFLTSSESFETLLNRWYKFESKFCFLCKSNTWQYPNHNISVKQKYFIVEMNSWIKENNKDPQQCRISSETFDIDSQEIFGKKWKIIAAIYGDSFDRYSTWRRYENKWIVITDEHFKIEDKLLDDFKDYKIFLFEKLEDSHEENANNLLNQDQQMITVCKYTTYSLLPPQPEIVHNLLPPQEAMETDEIHATHFNDPNIHTVTAGQQGNYFNQPVQPQPQISTMDYSFYPNNSTYYPPQQPFYPTFIEANNLNNNQNFMELQNHFNFTNPQNTNTSFYPLPFENVENSQPGPSGLQQMNFQDDYYVQNMDTYFYPIEENDEFSWFWNPQNGSF